MTQTKKTSEGDVIELLEDLPKFGIFKGQRGVIINKFDDPSEAYDIAIEDDDGEFVGFAYSVKPDQFKNIALASFEKGINLLNHGNFEEAEAPFREAIDLKPTFIGVLHNSLMHSFGDSTDYGRLITGLNFILRLNPNYGIARGNLAIAFRKYGIQAADGGDLAQADTYFQMALFVSTERENVLAVHQDYAAMFTKQGLLAFEANDPERSFLMMKQAFLFAPDELTKSNFAKSMAFLASKLVVENRYEEAESLFRCAIHYAGIKSPAFLNDYGIALANLGRFDEAVEIFLRALEVVPNDKTIQQNLNLARLGKETQDFAQESVELTFETPQPSRGIEFQEAQLPPQTPQYSLIAA